MVTLILAIENSTDLLPTRVSLLEKARSRNEDRTWEELLDYYAPFITKILLRMGFRGADLDDARQQVALNLWKGLRGYRSGEERAPFRNWLSKLIRHAAIDWIRSQRRHREKTVACDTDEINLLNPQDPEVESLIELEWQQHLVSMAMRNLQEVFSGKALEVFVRALEGESAEDIAKELDLRRESVYVLKTRVKTRLRHEILRLRIELEDPAHG